MQQDHTPNINTKKMVQNFASKKSAIIVKS